MVCVTALDIQVSLRNPTAMLEDSMTSVKNALLDIEQFPLTLISPGYFETAYLRGGG